jgi:hypothetical protein
MRFRMRIRNSFNFEDALSEFIRKAASFLGILEDRL